MPLLPIRIPTGLYIEQDAGIASFPRLLNAYVFAATEHFRGIA